MKLSEMLALTDKEKLALLSKHGLTKDPAVSAEVEKLEALWKRNPLQKFRPHPAGKDGRQAQLEFIEATTAIIAAFAGNRFGKSTVLGICTLRECLDDELLPGWLRKHKRFEAPVSGWILVPIETKIDDSFRPVFEKWTPKEAFQGGAWGKAFNGSNNTLRFSNGSTIAFKTYKQDHSTLGGASLHFVGYDEPPPKKHREECLYRLIDHGGFEMFAMTPLDVNTGYVRREIYKKRESPDITVVRGSIHDNPTLDQATKERALGSVSDIYRAAREFGEFVDVGGLIYPGFENCVVDEFKPEFVRGLRDVVVGIDPGMRNAGIIWVGFDDENVAFVFDEMLLQDKGVEDYARAIRFVNSKWQIRPEHMAYVCDPNARVRSAVDGARVHTALGQQGIHCNFANNDHETGFDQIRARMANQRLFVGRNCVGLRDEADEYVAKEPEEGKDDSFLEPEKGNDHRLDAFRYAIMERFWSQQAELDAPKRNLGFIPGKSLPQDFHNRRQTSVSGMF